MVRLSEKHCQLDLVACACGWSNVGVQEAGIIVVGALQEVLALVLLLFSLLCVDANGRVGSITCRQIRCAESQVEDVCRAGLRLLVECLHVSLPQTKIQQHNDWTWKSTQENKHRIDFLGIADTVQPQVHTCAPTVALLLGSGHFQDHRRRCWSS